MFLSELITSFILYHLCSSICHRLLLIFMYIHCITNTICLYIKRLRFLNTPEAAEQCQLVVVKVMFLRLLHPVDENFLSSSCRSAMRWSWSSLRRTWTHQPVRRDSCWTDSPEQSNKQRWWGLVKILFLPGAVKWCETKQYRVDLINQKRVKKSSNTLWNHLMFWTFRWCFYVAYYK